MKSGDRVNVIKAMGSNENGKLFSVGAATITDIACIHYLKSGEVTFEYELNNSGKYAQLVSPQEAALTR